MTTDIKELVRGRELRATLAERDDLMRRLRGQHRAIRSGYLKGLFLAAADALEAMAGEVEQANVKATSMQRWIDHHNERADKAEAQVEALRGENARLTEERDSAQRVGIQTMRERDEARADEELMSKAKQACEAENARLKGALEVFAAIKADDGDTFDKWDDGVVIRCEITVGDLKKARKALGGDK